MKDERDKSRGISFQATGKVGTVSMLKQLTKTRLWQSFDEDEALEKIEQNIPNSENLKASLEVLACEILRHIDNHVDPSTILLWASSDIAKLVKGEE